MSKKRRKNHNKAREHAVIVSVTITCRLRVYQNILFIFSSPSDLKSFKMSLLLTVSLLSTICKLHELDNQCQIYNTIQAE